MTRPHAFWALTTEQRPGQSGETAPPPNSVVLIGSTYDALVDDLKAMAVHELIVRKSASTDLRAIPKKDLAHIAGLAANPRPPGCEKLSALERHRPRQGRHRIHFKIQEARPTTTEAKVGHRRDAYRARGSLSPRRPAGYRCGRS